MHNRIEKQDGIPVMLMMSKENQRKALAVGLVSYVDEYNAAGEVHPYAATAQRMGTTIGKVGRMLKRDSKRLRSRNEMKAPVIRMQAVLGKGLTPTGKRKIKVIKHYKTGFA